MPRINSVKAARKPAKCNRCGKEIPVGSGYIYWEFRYGGMVKRCLACPRPRNSELTQSDKLSALWSAAESIEDADMAFQGQPVKYFEDFNTSDLAQAVHAAADQVREVGEEYRNSADNMTIEGGPKETLEEKADSCDSWADELESAADEIEAVEVEEINISDAAAMDWEEYAEAIDAAIDSSLYDAIQEAASKAEEVAGQTPDFM